MKQATSDFINKYPINKDESAALIIYKININIHL